MDKIYVSGMEFYGYHGLYPVRASRAVMDKACNMISKRSDFCGDSVDREKVRAQLEEWGYREPMNAEGLAAWLKDIVVRQLEKEPKDRDWYAEIGKVIDHLEGYHGN